MKAGERYFSATSTIVVIKAKATALNLITLISSNNC